MKTIQISDGKGGMAIPPMHGVVYNLQSVLQKNDKGSWYGWSVTQNRIMGQEDKSYTLRLKILVVLPLKETCKQKLMWKRNVKIVLRTKFILRGQQWPLYKEIRM